MTFLVNIIDKMELPLIGLTYSLICLVAGFYYLGISLFMYLTEWCLIISDFCLLWLVAPIQIKGLHKTTAYN